MTEWIMAAGGNQDVDLPGKMARSIASRFPDTFTLIYLLKANPDYGIFC
jgi:hypothetical protein